MQYDLSVQEQVIAAIRRITRAIDLHSRDLLQKNGMTIPQLAALRAIGRRQPVTVGELAKHIHLGQATVTGILDRLEKRGFIARRRGDRDRRSVVVQLTPDGEIFLAEAPSLLQERFHRKLSKLEQWEQTMILATLQRIATMMDADDIDAAPVLLSGDADAVPDDFVCSLESDATINNVSRLQQKS